MPTQRYNIVKTVENNWGGFYLHRTRLKPLYPAICGVCHTLEYNKLHITSMTSEVKTLSIEQVIYEGTATNPLLKTIIISDHPVIKLIGHFICPFI
jgi:hypothetical protein